MRPWSLFRNLLVLLVATLAMAAGPSFTAVHASSPADAGAAPGTTTPNPTPTTVEPFLDDTADLGACVSALPKPQCDTARDGDWHFYLVVGVLTAGLTFIGWRIVRGIRARDRALDPERT